MVRRKLSRKEVFTAAALILMALGILTFTIWHQTELINLGYQTRAAEEKISGLKEDIKTLEAKKTSLLSLDRVEQKARKELLLEPSKPEQVIFDVRFKRP